jgi:hypothetical protein
MMNYFIAFTKLVSISTESKLSKMTQFWVISQPDKCVDDLIKPKISVF